MWGCNVFLKTNKETVVGAPFGAVKLTDFQGARCAMLDWRAGWAGRWKAESGKVRTKVFICARHMQGRVKTSPYRVVSHGTS